MKIILLFFISWTLLFGNTFKPLTVLIDFPNYKYSDLHNLEKELVNQRRGNEFTPQLYQKMFFNKDEYTAYNGKKLISAKKFFDLESGGSFILEGSEQDIYGWFTAPKPIEYYGKNISKGGDRIKAAYLIKVALNKLVENKVNFSQYDLNNDGVIDGVVIVYAGKGEHLPNSLGSKAIWPHFNRINNVSSSKFCYFTDHHGKRWKIDKYAMVPQDTPLDLYIHEICHFLGLSDLYGNNSNIGYWSIMSNIYCGDIIGSKLNSIGAYHRYNIQKKYNHKKIPGFWAQIKNYDFDRIKKGIKIVKLYTSNHKKLDNLIKIDLPGRRGNIFKEGRDLYFTDNLNSDSSITFSVSLPRDADNILKFDARFNSNLSKENGRIYIRRIGEDRWFSLDNKNKNKNISKKKNNDKWIPLEFDLNKFNGENVEITATLLLSDKEWRKGVYISNLVVMSDTVKNFDLKTTKKKIIFEGFVPSNGNELLKRYLLIEYRNPIEKNIDEGLLHTELNIPYRKGLLIWYIDEGYPKFNRLVDILPSNKKPLYEIVNGKLKKLKLRKYIVSSWTFSSIDTAEMGIVKNNRVFYREHIHGKNAFTVADYININILKENEDYIQLVISYKNK